MKFRIVWSNFAANELDKIYEYYCEHASYRVAKNLLQKLIAEPNKLIDNFEIGQIEENLVNRNLDYRYLVCKNYKIIYSIDIENHLIKIADVFDTRQNPIKMKRVK